jgi:hypothetical protein|tara:strand:+ start:2208 stop:2861 length:654 start_codon:yes stop_codon:yes gene_type:complete
MTITRTVVSRPTNPTVVIEPVYSEGFINIYDIGSILDWDMIIEFAEHGHWGKSKVFNRGPLEEKSPQPHVDASNRDSEQQAFPAMNHPPVHTPVLRYSAKCLENYLAMFPAADQFTSFGVNEDYNIIRYKPGQAYHSVHADFHSDFGTLMSRRHLSGICFLNDIDEGGDLLFPQQDLSIKPEAGKFVVFPSGWTHAHKSIPAVGQTRYVFQIWWSFA